MAFSAAGVREILLTVVQGVNPGAQLSFPFSRQAIRLGRALDNDVVINDPSVSRYHARIEVAGESCTILDAGSAAGVEKMGFRLGTEPEPLVSGDEFKLGDTILRFELVADDGVLRPGASRPAMDGQETPAPRRSVARDLLGRLGLRTPSMQLAAAACVVLLLGLALWPGPAELPRQSKRTLAINYDALVGFTREDLSHLDGAVFRLPADNEGIGLYFDAFTRSGIEIRGESAVLAGIEGGKSWRSYELVLIPRARSTAREPELIFDNLGYAPADGNVDIRPAFGWALKEMWTVPVPRAAAFKASLLSALSPLRALADRLEDDPSHRYTLIRGLRPILIGCMKIVGRSALLVTIAATRRPEQPPVGKTLDLARVSLETGDAKQALAHLLAVTESVEGDLEREYRTQKNAVLVARKQQRVRNERLALEAMLQLVPEASDPRNRTARAELRKLGVPR